MNRRGMFRVCICLCFAWVLIQTLPEIRIAISQPDKPLATALSLRNYAQSITVKVLSSDGWGSGVVIRRQGLAHAVLTNDHVVADGSSSSLRVQTPDGRFYTATQAKNLNVSGNDLAVIQFRSNGAIYATASLATNSQLSLNEPVFASGFPEESGQFVFATGRVKLLPHQPFRGGYQIGSTTDIRKGMSGGPLLNREGWLVGINGRHAYPLWGNPYVFRDGSAATEAMQSQMRSLSWAIPLRTVRRFIAADQ
jgi:S1-C subfamily serine protease